MAGVELLDEEVIALLESGCALIVGLVTASGVPHATRGWGLDLIDRGTRARLLLVSSEIPALGFPPGAEIRSMIAVTGCNVRSLRSVQLKGPLERVEAAEPRDCRRMEAYCQAFFDDV